MSKPRPDQFDRKYLAEFLNSPELQSILENPLPTMLWTADTHQNVAAWVRESGRCHRRSVESKSRAGNHDKVVQSRQKRGVTSTTIRLRQTLEHPAELADISREIWSQALVKKDGQAPIALSPKEDQVISKTNCRALINLQPAAKSTRSLLLSALDGLLSVSLDAFHTLTSVPRSQRQG